MSTLAAAFGISWMLTTAYLAWLGSKHWILTRRLDALESRLSAPTRGSASTHRSKVA